MTSFDDDMDLIGAVPAVFKPEPRVDLEQARRFLKTLAPGVSVTFQTFDDRPAPKRSALAQWRHGSFEQHAEWLQEMNQQGAGVFVTVNQMDGNGRKQTNTQRVRALFVDIDDPVPGVLEQLLEDAQPPSIVVESSAGKWHAYWLTDAVELTEFKEQQTRLIEKWGGDPACNDLPRVLRLPGFLHQKDPKHPQLTQIVKLSDRRYGPELLARFGESSPPSPAQDSRVVAALAGLARGDSLHDNARIITADFAQHGVPASTTRALFEHIFAPQLVAVRGDDRVNELLGGELDRLLDGAERKYAPIEPKQFSFVRASEMKVSSVSWLVHGYFEEDTVALIFGPPAKGKSFLALDICCCVAEGVPFHGHEVSQGAVFYIAGEGHNGIARRIHAWGQHNGRKGAPSSLFVSEAPADLVNAANAERIADAVEALAASTGLKPKLIVVDTMARNFIGDENSSQDVGRFVANVDAMRRRWNATVIIVHHSGKDWLRGARGSSALKGAVDAEYEVSRNETDSLVRMIPHKMKDAEAPPALAFKLQGVTVFDDNGGTESSAVLVLDSYVELSNSDVFDGLGTNQRRALTVLGKMPAPVAVSDWREKCREEGLDRKRFSDLRDTLQRRGLIIIQDGVVESLEDLDELFDPFDCPSVRSPIEVPDRTDVMTRVIR